MYFTERPINLIVLYPVSKAENKDKLKQFAYLLAIKNMVL